jgi:hypothetical protein
MVGMPTVSLLHRQVSAPEKSKIRYRHAGALCLKVLSLGHCVAHGLLHD